MTGATSLGTATKAELSSGKTFSGLSLGYLTLYWILIQYSGTTVGTGTTTSPGPTVTSVTPTSTYNSITAKGTTSYSVTYNVYYNTTNSMTGATSLGTATQAEFTSGKTFTGLSLSPNTLYYVILQYSSTTMGSGSTTSPAPTVTSVSPTSTYNSITAIGTADYATTYLVYYNTTNSMTGATLLGTATKAQLTSGQQFTGLSLSPSTLYYVIIQYSGTTVGTGSTTSPIPSVTPVSPDRKSTRLNSSHVSESRMPSSA